MADATENPSTEEPTRFALDLPANFMTMTDDEIHALAKAMYGPIREALGLPPVDPST